MSCCPLEEQNMDIINNKNTNRRWINLTKTLILIVILLILYPKQYHWPTSIITVKATAEWYKPMIIPWPFPYRKLSTVGAPPSRHSGTHLLSDSYCLPMSLLFLQKPCNKKIFLWKCASLSLHQHSRVISQSKLRICVCERQNTHTRKFNLSLTTTKRSFSQYFLIRVCLY